MAIIQANVPQAHLATAMGNPNQMLVEYSTDLLLPVPGPYLIAQLRRDFLRGLMMVNDFLVLVEDAHSYQAAGGTVNLSVNTGPQMLARSGDRSEYGRKIVSPARLAMDMGRSVTPALGAQARRPNADPVLMGDSLLARLSAPNLVAHDMFEAGLMQAGPFLRFGPGLAGNLTFNVRCARVIRTLLSTRQSLLPQAVTPIMIAIANQTMATARAKHPRYLHAEFASLTPQTTTLLIQWLVAYHLDKTPSIAVPFAVDLSPVFGFSPAFFVKEWALNRKERLRLVFGTPNLRGPLGAEPVTPQGIYRREDYSASQNELALLTAESRRTRTLEGLSLASGTLRRELDTVYYSGPGTVNELTSQASNSLLTEERRRVVFSMIREVSEARESASLNVSTQITSSTITREAHGVDPKLAATHHRFKVVVPITATVEMYDVGLTWSPRVVNPFYELHQAIHNAYGTAYEAHINQYYVPEPVGPARVFESYIVDTDLEMHAEDAPLHINWFSIPLPSTDRADYPDFANWSVVWNQSESMWNDDPDHFTARLTDPYFQGGVIGGNVRLETDDGGADFQGFAHIEVPVLRYSQATVDALTQHELALQDYALKRRALEAQAHQYASIKQREFIERHEQREPLFKIVFYELVRRLCLPTLAEQISYYKEVLSGCIDWSNAKMDFEPASLNVLAFPDFEADHFVNSLWVRLFLPINRGAEATLFDALTACGTLAIQESVANALNQVNAIRDHLQQNGPDQIDQFSTEMVIGDHIEGVMSARELAS